MTILFDIQELGLLDGPLHLAIGVFDGVHLGHQAVVQEARETCKSQGGKVVAVTFDPHPVTILAPREAPRLLTSTRHKAQLFEKLLGVKTILAIPFDLEFSETPGDLFIRQLCEAGAVGSISVGLDFQFGKKRSGNIESLTGLSAELNFQLNATGIVEIEDTVVSSTRIRLAIEEGDFNAARVLLGRDYTVLGTVVKGRQLGRTIGFPTQTFPFTASNFLRRESMRSVPNAGESNSGNRQPGIQADHR